MNKEDPCELLITGDTCIAVVREIDQHAMNQTAAAAAANVKRLWSELIGDARRRD